VKYLEILRAALEALNEQRDAAVADMEAATKTAADESRSALNDTETAAYEEARSVVTKLDGEIDSTKERIAELEQVEAKRATAKDVPQVIRKTDPTDVLEQRDATPTQIADAVMRSLENELGDGEELRGARTLLKRHGADTEWSRQVLARSTPLYERAFGKLIATGGQMGALTSEEQRAIAVGTNTQGGFMVPTVIDPSFIYTNDGASAAIRRISRVVTLTGAANAVTGVATAGITASWDDELEEVSDDAPAISRPTVPIHRAQAFVPYSIESDQDIPGLTDQLRAALADAKDRLEAAAFATGSGTGEPTGIFTALDANTNVELTTTTAATVGLVDLHAVYRALPIRWRSRAAWAMNPLWLGGIRQLGSAVGASFSGDLRDPLPERLIGRPVVEIEEAPEAQTTTQLDNILVFGDFSNYVIADKPASMMVEFIPHVFGATNSRPIGARALYAFWRTGADSVNDLAFRLLQDKTSA
jgi:HK97 family phage major capsid protein